jgi:hypothetical protein
MYFNVGFSLSGLQEVTAEKLDEDLDSYFKTKPSKKDAGEDVGDVLEDIVDGEEVKED